MALVSNFHEQVSYNGAEGEIHGCTMDLFIILTLEEEVDIFDRIPLMWCCMTWRSCFVVVWSVIIFV